MPSVFEKYLTFVNITSKNEKNYYTYYLKVKGKLCVFIIYI
jgi:hypothetical protein